MATQRPVLSRENENPTSTLITVVGIAVVVAGLYFGRQMLIPLALGVVFAFLLAPIAGLLEKLRLGRVPSVLAVLILSFTLLGVVGWGVSKQLLEVVAHLDDYKDNIEDKIEAIRPPASGSLGKATAALNDLTRDLSATAKTVGNDKLKNRGKEPITVQVTTPPHNVTEFIRDVAGPLTGILETAGIVVIFTLFILIKREDLRNRLLRLMGRGQLTMATQGLDAASRRLGRYLFLQFAVNAGYGTLFGLGVYLLGIPHPLLWGVLACLLRFIPYIGAPVAAAFPIAMAMAVFPGWSQVVLTLALFIFMEVVTANFVEPWLYGAHTGVSSLAVLVAAIFWSMLWGPVGLILSTPLTVCLIIMGSYIPQLKFLAILLGDEPPLPPHVIFYQRLLALDDEEARSTAENYLKEHPLGTTYDSLLVPALSLAEQDRHMNAVDENRTKFIQQCIRDLIEELHEASLNAVSSTDEDSVSPSESVGSNFGRASSGAASSGPATPGSKIVCVPARDEADEIVGIMVAQLLQRAGQDAQAISIGPVATMLEQVGELHADVVCLSALPPFAAGQAKSLCTRLRQRYPRLKIVVGLWEYPGGLLKAQERMGVNCANLIGTSLAQIVPLMAEGNALACAASESSGEAPLQKAKTA